MEAGDPTSRRVAHAILSVDDKRDLVPLARALADLGVEIWATSGTRRALAPAGVKVRSVEELTGVDAWFGGRVKTLHPAIFGGILAPRTPEGMDELARRELRPFELVVVNFYPFERHLREHPDAADREEFIDIGGVSLVRAAAKNHDGVAVVTDPAQYASLIAELKAGDGRLAASTRRRLAVEAFVRCADYDAAIARGLGAGAGPPGPFPETLLFTREPLGLRYGENPHQHAAAYTVTGGGGLAADVDRLEVLKGDPPSFNNLLDLDAVAGLVDEFEEPAAAVVKHATPCGVATGATGREALDAAIATDPVARYGCAVAVNRPFGADATAALKGVFVDLLLAPAYDREALTQLARRPKIKVLRRDQRRPPEGRWEARSALGRLLVQEADRRPLETDRLKRVAGPELSRDDLASLAFAWKVVRYAKSNAIVLAQGRATVGVGSGQPTRVKSVELACQVAGERARGAVLASDAFFPFADGVEIAGRAGVRAIVQPGGSLRDAEVIAAAERYGIAMYFTGWRVFRH